MTTTQMKCFLMSAELLSFTAAAERLYIAQPTLSRQISMLEQEVGAQLFIRRNNVLAMTRAGELLREGLSGVYSEINSILKRIGDYSSENAGGLSVGLLEDQILDAILINSLQSLVQKRPKADISLGRRDTNGLFQGLMDGSLDVAVLLVYDDVNHSDFNAMQLYDDSEYIAVSMDHPAAQRESFTMQDAFELSGELPLVMASLEAFPLPMREALSKEFPPASVDRLYPAGLKPVSSFGAIPLFVTAGLGFSLVNGSNVLSLDPKVKLIPVTGGGKLTKGLLWRTRNKNPVLGDFLELIE